VSVSVPGCYCRCVWVLIVGVQEVIGEILEGTLSHVLCTNLVTFVRCEVVYYCVCVFVYVPWCYCGCVWVAV